MCVRTHFWCMYGVTPRFLLELFYLFIICVYMHSFVIMCILFGISEFLAWKGILVIFRLRDILVIRRVEVN